MGGCFRRIVKLLFHNIRPIFVFDGGVPTLKKRTIQMRRARREEEEIGYRKTTQRLLLAHLKKQIIENSKRPEEGDEVKAKNLVSQKEGDFVGIDSFNPGTQKIVARKPHASK